MEQYCCEFWQRVRVRRCLPCAGLHREISSCPQKTRAKAVAGSFTALSSRPLAAGSCPRQSGCAHSLRLVTLEDRWPCRLPSHEDGAVQGPIPHHLVTGIHNLLPLPLKHQSQQRARWHLWISRIPFTLLRHRHTAGSSGLLGLMASTWRRLRIASCEFLTNDIRALTQPLAPSEPSADAALVTR